MYIAQVFSIILISFGAAACYLGISATRKQFREFLGNLLLGLLCFASAIWSYGFGMVFLTTSTKVAYWGRTIGMIGVFGFLIIVQILVGVLVKIPYVEYCVFVAFAFLGVFIYYPTVMPSSTIYYMGDWGMTYTFQPGLANNIYTAYSLIFAVNMCISVYQMLKYAQGRRNKVTGHKIVVTMIVIFGGMVLDTILPMFGFGAVPGSSITQFIGLLVMYYAIVDFNKTRITPMNMSSYVYTSVSEPVMVLTVDGNLKLANNAAEKLLKGTIDINGDSEVPVWDILEVSSDHLDYDGDHRTDDSFTVKGHIPIQIQTSKIRDKYGDQIGYILTIKNMTRITEMMDSLKEAKKLADANNIAKSAFLANMSHEIRTPLNAIVGFSELLLKSDMKDKDREQVEDIRNSSHNLLAIINDVLDISKIESGKMELNETEYNIAEVIKDAYLITDTISAKKGLEFSADIDESIPSQMFGDPVRIRGILVNILNNAVKYTRQGSVKLSGNVDHIHDGMVYLKFSISDTGIGIKEEDIGKLFESFTQVDKKINTGIEGTGLGLAIVKGFIDLMGGSINIESKYGEGTTFTLIIPQKILNDAPIGKIDIKNSKSDAKSSIGDVKYTGVKVLAVDDNKVNLKVISRVLAKYEMEVTTADSGPEAIEMCGSHEYDIVLMDQMMPGMDGIEAMKNIRKLSSYYDFGGKCIIIALTANAITGAREELIGEGFDDYLSKPIEFARMEEMFNQFTREGRIKLSKL